MQTVWTVRCCLLGCDDADSHIYMSTHELQVAVGIQMHDEVVLGMS